MTECAVYLIYSQAWFFPPCHWLAVKYVSWFYHWMVWSIVPVSSFDFAYIKKKSFDFAYCPYLSCLATKCRSSIVMLHLFLLVTSLPKGAWAELLYPECITWKTNNITLFCWTNATLCLLAVQCEYEYFSCLKFCCAWHVSLFLSLSISCSFCCLCRLQYYMRTGMCKFGASCKYNHPRQGGGSPSPVTFNIYGYPMRPVSTFCPFQFPLAFFVFFLNIYFDYMLEALC